ncbi:hypothetical protein GCM10022233_50850 [Streptomyces shaanxiensis]|uniref:Uncharacterized protein n=2 Tax=Streptomyces shaanxiensis TaxID=653357 RepID=A0ABP7VKI4_9ACTN
MKKHATGLRILMIAALAGGMTTAFGGTAQAAVSGCHADRDADTNIAVVYCEKGFGSYRVAAKCDSPNYPYSITIYGSWVKKVSGDLGDDSFVEGDKYNCHIVKAWADTR